MRRTSQKRKFDGRNYVRSDNISFEMHRKCQKSRETSDSPRSKFANPYKRNYEGKMVLNLQNRYILLDE